MDTQVNVLTSVQNNTEIFYSKDKLTTPYFQVQVQAFIWNKHIKAHNTYT